MNRQVNKSEDERHLLEGLAIHDPKAIEEIYRANYNTIQAYIIKNSGYADDARDIFQEALIVLFENVQSKSFELTCSIRTYLYSVSRRLWLKKIQREKRSYSTAMDVLEDTVPVEEELELHEQREAEFNHMEEAMEELGEPCKSLLKTFYIQKKSMPEIADLFGYTNPNNAKTQKYKCLVRLKKIFFKRLKNGE